MNARKNASFAFQFVKPILQTITHLLKSWHTIHGFRVSVLVRKMIRKKISSISIPSNQAMQAITMNRLDDLLAT